MLQMHWKPQEEFRNDFGLHERDDIINDDTFVFNSRAGVPVMSTVTPAVIDSHFVLSQSRALNTRERTDAKDAQASGLLKNGKMLPPPRDCINNRQHSPKNEKSALVELCPSAYPYLLTLRGHNVQKDLVLYPLESQTVTVGRQSNGSSSSQDGFFINLYAEDVLLHHCRIHLKNKKPTLPSEKRRYWYDLQLEVWERAAVYVNGVNVEHTAWVHPGDIIGVGQEYLFLYKDPTGGYDIPKFLPWYPEPCALYAQVNKTGVGTRRECQGSLGDDQQAQTSDESGNEINAVHGVSLDDEDKDPERTEGDVLFTVPYSMGREREVLQHIVNVSCCSPSQYPLTTTILLLGCYGYASRCFPPSHLPELFRTLSAVTRNRVSEVSKTLSTQKFQTNLYTAVEDNLTDDFRDGDPLLELLCWLSNAVRLYCHFTSIEFHQHLGDSQPAADVTGAVEELCDGLKETINFMFQQTVYCITKELFGSVAQMLPSSLTATGTTDNTRIRTGMDRALHVLRVTLDLCQDVSLHGDVMIQLLIYLIFFVTTTLFNRLMTKGFESKQLCWSVGVGLQCCMSSLENWVSSVGLETHYVTVAQPLVSLVDLLATSAHTLLTMTWSSFRDQYSPLSEAQLVNVLSGYRFTDGHSPPDSWFPPPGVKFSGDVTIDLTSHPPFVLPLHSSPVDLQDTFPPSLYRHLDHIVRLFPLHTTDVHTENEQSLVDKHQQPDLNLPISSQATFFSSLSSPNTSHLHFHLPHHSTAPRPTPSREHSGDDEQNLQSPPLPHRHRGQDKDVPPPLPPRLPPRSPVKQSTIPFSEHSATDSLNSKSPQQKNDGFRSQELLSGVSFGTGGILDSSCHPQTDIAGADARQSHSSIQKQEDVRGNASQNGKTPRYTLLPSKYNPSSQNIKNQDQEPHFPESELNKSGQFNTKTLKSENSVFNPSSQINKTQFQQYSQGSQSSGAHNYLEQSHPTLKTKLFLDHKNFIPQKRLNSEGQINTHQTHELRFLPEPKPRDPRRRPLNGLFLPNGPLTLQDERVLNKVPSLEIPSENVSMISDSAVSDDVFIQSSTDLPPWSFGSSVQASEFRRFSTGMLSEEKSDTEPEERPAVVTVPMCQGQNGDDTTVDRSLDDIYIDVMKEVGTHNGSVGKLSVLPLDNGVIRHSESHGCKGEPILGGSQAVPQVRYRHTMPQDRDGSTKGEITGEVFTLTLIKEGSKLGMGLIDGMHTALKLPGIYVRNVLPGTPAALCGHIRVGDRILAVNGRSIVGADYNSAMKLIRSTAPRLNLLIAKCDRSVTAAISAS